MNKTALSLGVAGMLIYCVPVTPVKATSMYSSNLSSEDMEKSVGIISGYYLSVSSGSNIIYISARTQAKNNMQTLGYTDITVEYSSDGNNWYQEKYVGNLLISDSSTYYLNNFAVTVKGGYYYRIRLNHYADESGLFGSSQTIANISNTVWID